VQADASVIGASEGSFHEGFYPEPIAASAEYIENYKKEWLKSVERCKEIGFDFIEIHGAHGYLIHGMLYFSFSASSELEADLQNSFLL
jgi:2,4-dienoyl-CoA reductase-like NADH-dependent reductase (Old Yellow Enzyme family)